MYKPSHRILAMAAMFGASSMPAGKAEGDISQATGSKGRLVGVEGPSQVTSRRIPRNARCVCGSGLKAKKCCLVLENS